MTSEAASARVTPPVAPAGGERWAMIEALLHDALAQPIGARSRFLAGVCPDADVRREVESLIAAHERPGKLDALSAVIAPLRERPTRASPAADALPQVDRYQILARLGGGGMGIVYHARDTRLEREVALKFLPPHLSADEAAKKRFLVEARAAAALEHANICTVHEIGETADGQLYIVMGYYAGETLDRRIARGPLPVADAVRIASDVARGLTKAHDRGIIHRDIKPANIMLTTDGVVKILDFGIAKLSDIGVSQTVGAIGTIAYMSPEQAFGEVVDRRTDIWSLGVVLYEMLAGIHPFRGPGNQAVLFSILTHAPDVLRNVPPELAAIVGRALAKRPDDRFPSTHEVIAALGAVPAASRARADVTAQTATSDGTAGATPTESVLTGAGERRQAAIVVTGIANYGALLEHLTANEIDAITAAVRDAAAEAATRHGGIVNHFAGDDLVLVFGVATSHEDDYLRAVRSALDLHARVRELSQPLERRAGPTVRMRSGVHTGLVVAQRQRSGGQRFRITGAPLDVASRLAAVADGDAVLITPECHRLVAPFVEAVDRPPLTLLADAPPVAPYQVLRELAVQARLPFAERGSLTPYAGRGRELAQLDEQLTAAHAGRGSMAVVIGEAGSGKSRLLFELRQRLEEGSVRLAIGRCDAYGRQSAYLPFVEVIRELLALPSGERAAQHDAVIARLRDLDRSLDDYLAIYLALLSIPSEQHSLPAALQGEQLHAAMLEAITALITLHAARRPIVLLFEDWHWSDEASRSALSQLSEVAAAHPLLIVVTSRPDGGIAWTGGDHRTLIHLGPLTVEASIEIMRAVLGAERVAPAVVQQLYDRTGGNPFFLEETCHALLEQGVIERRDGVAVAANAAAPMQLPETVQAVIRTRLDRLDPEARDAVRVASVIGREFTRGVLDDTAGATHDLTRALERLRANGIIQQTAVVPEPLYRFKHVLTQEVAYDTLLEHQRKTLHGAAGRAIEQRYQHQLDDHLERLALHFARAEEWRDAIRYGIRSAARATALSQLSDALSTLERVEQWLVRLDDPADRDDLTVDVLLRQERLCETLGLRQRQLRIAADLIALLEPRGRSAALAEAYLRQGDACTLLRRFDAADRSLATALRISRERADRAAERNVVRSIGLLRSHEGRNEEAIASFEQALVLDRELGETHAAAGDLASLGNMYRKVGRQTEALHALEEALEGLTSEASWGKRAAVKVVIAAALRDLGQVDKALHTLDGLADEAVERRNPIQASFALLQVAHIHLEQGRIEDSLRTYWQAVDMTRRGGHTDGLVQSLRAVGEVLVGLGRYAESLPALTEAAALFAQLEDREAEALMRARIATAHERCGQPVDAQRAWELAARLCRDRADLHGEVAALEGVGRAARQAGAVGVAMARYEEALARAQLIGDREREVSIRNSLAILHWEAGTFAEAMTHYEEALRLTRALGDRGHEGLLLNSLGATLLRLRRFEEARTVLEEGLHVNSANGQRRLLAHTLAALGDACLASGRVEDARRHVEASLGVRRELDDRRGEAWMLERLARILDVQRRPAEAESARADAARLAGEVGDDALRAALAAATVAASANNTNHR